MILPEGFGELFKESLGSSAYERYSSAISDNPTACVRINPSKFSCGELLAQWPDAQQVPWCSNGFYLRERPNFTLDPLFHAGAYYVQDASSMFLEGVFRQIAASRFEPATENPFVSAADSVRCDSAIQHTGSLLRVLDLCAAPGGKSTHLLSLLGPDSLLVSNEVISSRATILKENLAIWGSANVVVTSSDSEIFASHLPEFFDIVLVDAPCSGEGMFRKMDSAHGNAATENWSPDNVQLCAARQQRILSSAVKSLKPGGWLIYSTCTYNHFENDDQLAFLKSGFGLEVQPISLFDKYSHSLNCIASASSIDNNSFPGINHTNDSAPAINSSCANTSIPALVKTINGGYQFIPGLVRSEGQFCALLHLPQSPLAPQPQSSPLGDGSTTCSSGSSASAGTELPVTQVVENNACSENNSLYMPRCGEVRSPEDFRYGIPANKVARNKYGRRVDGNRKLNKRGGGADSKSQKNSDRIKVPEAMSSLIDVLNKSCEDVIVRQQGELFKILPANLAIDIDCISSSVRVLGSGVALGCVKGKDFIPDAQLATYELLAESDWLEHCCRAETAASVLESNEIEMDSATMVGECKSGLYGKGGAFKAWDVDRETALKFLAKQLNVLENAPLGVLLICYRGRGLGFVKNIGRRVNNLLPNARRILNM